MRVMFPTCLQASGQRPTNRSLYGRFALFGVRCSPSVCLTTDKANTNDIRVCLHLTPRYSPGGAWPEALNGADAQ